MFKVVFSLLVLLVFHPAMAKIVIVDSTEFCGKANVKPLLNEGTASEVSEPYYASIVVQAANVNPVILEKGLEPGESIAELSVWLYYGTYDQTGAARLLVNGNCYCVTGRAGGSLSLFGFQEVSQIEEISCAAN